MKQFVARARLDLRLPRHARRVAADGDPARLARLEARPRPARDRHPRRRRPRASRGAGAMTWAFWPLLAVIAVAVGARAVARRRRRRRRPHAHTVGADPRAVHRRRARPDRARGRDPDRARRGRDARPGLPDRRPARAARGRADAAAGHDGDAAARGGRARRAAGGRAGRRADRERPHAVHALKRLWESEHFDRIVVPAPAGRSRGFTPKDLTWMLTHAPSETLILRPDPAGRRERRASNGRRR